VNDQLTDEERQRIYEEEKARADARLKIEQENKAAAEAPEAKKEGGGRSPRSKGQKGLRNWVPRASASYLYFDNAFRTNQIYR
jgi:hypothetical protein